MGKTMNLSGMSEEECESILSVLNRDTNLRIRELQRLSQIQQEVDSESAKRSILSRQSEFNEKYCILCCSAFNFLFNKKHICHVCKYHVCRNCAVYDKFWICRVCEKQRSLYLQSYQWNCDNDTKANTVLFGSAKLLKFFLEQRKAHSDEQSDNCTESGIIMNENFEYTDDMDSTQSKVTSDSVNDSSPEEDPAIIQVREHIEVLVEGFLGLSLDSAHVDRPYIDEQYNDLFVEYKEKLSLTLLDLTRALYLAMQNKPIYDDNTPSNAHVALKELIISITKSTSQLPCLTKKDASLSMEDISSSKNISFNFNSYEELLATAIINQIVETCQIRHRNPNGQFTCDEQSHINDIGVSSDNCETESVSSFSDRTITVTTASDDEKDIISRNIIMNPPSFVINEQIEEITTKSYSDFEDDPKNSMSDNDYYYPELNVKQTPLKVPFPEAGVDIVDINMSEEFNDEELCEDSGIRLINLLSWEENWLFQKRKHANDKQSFRAFYGYHSLDLLDNPVSMLIPNPSQTINTLIGTQEIDEISDLSEHNSVGSIEFSDDESDEIQLKSDNNTNENMIDKSVVNSNQSQRKNNNNNNNRKFKKFIAQQKLIVPDYVPLSERIDQENSGIILDPYFIIKPGDASVQCGILVQFCCRAKGTKPIKVAWFKNSSLIKSCDNIRLFQCGDEHIFEIKRTNLDDTSHYSCVIYNHCGSQWCDFNLKVRNETLIGPNMSKFGKRKSKPIAKHVNPNPGKNIAVKTAPIVIQRTWAERADELKRSSCSKAQDDDDVFIKHDLERPQSADDEIESLMSPDGHRIGKIAEREHRKWETAVNWPENPYTAEKINERIKQRSWIADTAEAVVPDDVQKDKNDETFFVSIAKDLNRYKKDYYVPNFSKEETVRSFDESEYSSSKYFEIPQENDKNKNKPQPRERKMIQNNNVKPEEEHNNRVETVLPSVKDLVSKFSSHSNRESQCQKPEIYQKNNNFSSKSCDNLTEVHKKASPRMVQMRDDYKIHSLTARSMSKEFREMSQKNTPRILNRMNSHPNNLIFQHESESSGPCSPTNDGYVSDESNSSSATSNNGNKTAIEIKSRNPERKMSRNVLKRASFWEKRCERGLLSDSSVNEDFPPIDTIMD